jgi:hypothetical protein
LDAAHPFFFWGRGQLSAPESARGEGWTGDENPLEGVDLASLKLVRLTQLG